MKIKLDSYDDLPLNKTLCIFVLNTLCESVFSDSKQVLSTNSHK